MKLKVKLHGGSKVVVLPKELSKLSDVFVYSCEMLSDSEKLNEINKKLKELIK